MTTTIFRAILDEFASAFESDTRNDGQRFYKRRDDCAPWVDTDVMMAIHQAIDDRMPDDWVYETAARVASDLLEYDSESADDARDNATEIADSLVDVYTGDRLRWLAPMPATNNRLSLSAQVRSYPERHGSGRL